MKSLWHWLTELAEVYARHAGRHGPNRLLPAETRPRMGGFQGTEEPPRRALVPTGARRSPLRRRRAHASGSTWRKNTRWHTTRGTG
jgi:hypothetical protein